jgi:hypothetical protein
MDYSSAVGECQLLPGIYGVGYRYLQANDGNTVCARDDFDVCGAYWDDYDDIAEFCDSPACS